jgi:DNA polymerase-3 subunit epsilon
MAVLDWLKGHKQTPAPVLKAFNAAPRPHPKTAPGDCPLLVLDIETTGLDPRKDHMVSIGWLPVRERRIVVAEARHHLTQSPVSVGQSATVHGMLDRDLVGAREISTVLQELLSTYAGYIFVAHHARLDKAFLQAAIQSCFGGKADMPFIDTMAIEKHRLQRQGLEITQESLRLDNCLRRYGLENSVAQHHALEDAYSCALLLLAQTSRTKFTLADLLRQS